jgi:hypothetical protein
MGTMTIPIPVDPETGQAFAKASAQDQRKLQLLLSLRLRELTSMPARPLRVIMDEIGRKAEAQGLTLDQLASLLHDD